MAPFQPNIGPVVSTTADRWEIVEKLMGIALDLDNVAVNAYLHDKDHLYLRRWYIAHQAGATKEQVGRWITNPRGKAWQQTRSGLEAINQFISYLEDKINHFCPADVYFDRQDGQFGFWEVPEDEEPSDDEIRRIFAEAPPYTPPAYKEGVEVDIARFASGPVVRVNVDLPRDAEDDELLFVALVAVARRYAEAVGNADRPWINLQGLYENLVADDEIPGTLTIPVKKAPRPFVEAVDETHTTLRAELEKEARAWLIDCFPDEEADIREAGLPTIQAAVDKYYDGGITSFTLATIGRTLNWLDYERGA